MNAPLVPDNWYRFAYPPEMAKLPWAQKTASEVDRLIAMLDLDCSERVLDLACGTGRHALELTRRGFSVVAVELLAANVQVAREATEGEPVSTEFVQADLRELEFTEELDLVLSLNDGAIGYFETEAENERTFEVISRALRPGGPPPAADRKRLHAEKFMPMKGWIEGPEAIELVDHHWNRQTRCWEGTTASLVIGEVFEGLEWIPFRKRLYSVDELGEICALVGMEVTNVFRGNGKAGRPRTTQYEVFVEGRKG